MSPRVPESILLAAVAFAPLAFGATEPWSSAVLQALLFAAAAAALFVSPLAGERPVTTALTALLALSAIGMLQCVAFAHPWGPSTAPSTHSLFATARTVVLWLSYAALVWTLPRAFPDIAAARRLAWTLTAVGTLVAVIGLVQLAQGNQSYYGLRSVGGGTPFGPFANRTHAAALLTVTGWIGVGLWVSLLPASNRRRTWAEQLPSLAIASLSLIVTLVGIAAARSRGAAVAVAVSAAGTVFVTAGLLRDRRMTGLVRGALAISALAVAAMLAASPALMRMEGAALDRSSVYRLLMYRAGAEMVLDRPLTGTGLGTVLTSFRYYKPAFIVEAVDHLHNDWLELTVQAGLPALLVALATGWVFARRSRVAWSAMDGQRRCLSAGALAATAACALHSLVDFPMQIPALVVVSLAGAALVLPAPAPLDVSRRVPVPVALAGVLMAGLFAVVAALPATARAWGDAGHVRDPRAQRAHDRAIREIEAATSAHDPVPALRRAMADEHEALRLCPAEPRFRLTAATILRRLDRGDDASLLLEEAYQP